MRATDFDHEIRICQAASALIEPAGERTPAWLQLVKHLGNAYAGAPDSAAAVSSPLWSVLSGLAQDSSTSSLAKVSSQSAPNSQNTKPTGLGLLASIAPIVSLLSGQGFVSAKDSSGSWLSPAPSQKDDLATSASSKKEHSSGGGASTPLANALANTLSSSTLTNLALAGWASNALASLVGYFAPSTPNPASTFARRKKPFEPDETFVDTPASLASQQVSARSQQQAQQQQQLLPQIGKQPPTPCPSVEEYISPTFARNYQGNWKYVVQIPNEGYFTQTIQRTSCVRQKCEFTEGVCHESPRWVSLLVAEIYYPNAIAGSGGTVMSAPAPGHTHMSSSQATAERLASASEPSAQFMAASAPLTQHHTQMQTQQQPNAQQLAAIRQQQILLMQQQQQQQQQYASAQQANAAQPTHMQHRARIGAQQTPSASSATAAAAVGQDPMQMTDSLSAYNTNLNNAFISAAQELGMDPNNVAHMQHLANAYNYQLLQRNGLITGSNQQQQPQQQAERRSLPAMSAAASNVQPTFASPQASQTSQQQQATPTQQAYNSDYIAALAASALQQNPHMNINDLINSLQIALAQGQTRKKRDLGQPANNMQQMQQQQQQHHNNRQSQQQQQHQHQHISNTNYETVPSMNELGSNLPYTNRHQQSAQSQASSLVPEHQPSGAPQPPQASQGPASPSVSEPVSPVGDSSSASTAQECDGHDKLGCYVVRVYYDWFLVNGSCKCWKTQTATTNSNGGSTSAGNSFLRRIFTG